MDRVERVEELLLRPLLARDELDVVDEEDVDPAVALTELLALLTADRVDELVRELLARGVGDALLRMTSDHRVPDGVHQVRLAQARPAVHEQRVVAVSRSLRDGERRGVREAVVGADDECRERVPRIEQRARLGISPLGERRALRGRAGLRPVRDSGTRPHPGERRRLRHEADVDGAAKQVLQRGPDLRAVLVLEPFASECVRDGDEVDVIFL